MSSQTREIGENQRLFINGGRVHQKSGATQTTRGKARGNKQLIYFILSHFEKSRSNFQEERSRIDDLRGTPMNVGTLEEVIDDQHAIVSTVRLNFLLKLYFLNLFPECRERALRHNAVVRRQGAAGARLLGAAQSQNAQVHIKIILK